MTRAAFLVLLAVGAHGAQPLGGQGSLLQAGQDPNDPNEKGPLGSSENHMEKVPVAGQAFKVDKVSTSMQCVISLTIQYMIVYTALAIGRTAAKSMGVDYGKTPVLEILKTATYTVSYAPMLAILFLACRMRVTWLSQRTGNPPVYVQTAMYCCTYSVLAMTLVVCIIPIFTGKVINVDTKTGDIKDDAKPFEQPIIAGCFTALKFLIMLGLYVGAIMVIYGIINYVPPKGIWPGDVAPPVSPAVGCTCILTCQYFIVYAAIQFAKSVEDWMSLDSPWLHTLKEACETATLSMNFAPMLAVLFIAARMRALQMDPVHGHPQTWAQNCFYMCTYALMAQTILCIAIPVVLGGKAKKGNVEGDMEYEVNNMVPGALMTAVRFLITICIYVGFSCVIYSIFTIEHPKGPQYTPPISVTMQCVINLTAQFFVVYLGLWIAQTVKDFIGWEMTRLSELMQDAKATIAFCPMLAILFVGTRMRALLITNNRGAPQGWVQDGMYMATWAVLIQFLMVLLVGLASASRVRCDEDGSPEWKPEHPILIYIALGLKWLTFLFLYGGIIAVIVGVYTMTPETANGRGAVPLVGDGKVPGTEVGVPGYKKLPEPVGGNDLPPIADKQKGPAADAEGPGFF